VSGRATPDQLAELVAEKLRPAIKAEVRAAVAELHHQAPRLETAKETGARIGKSARWVREHKVLLGGTPMSDGPRPTLMFDPAHVDRVLESRRLS